MKSFVEIISPIDVQPLICEMEGLMPVSFRAPGYAAEYLREPHVTTAALSFDGEKAYLLAYHVTGDKGFWVDMCGAIKSNKRDHTDNLFRTIEELAAKAGCKYIAFLTARHGLIKLAENHGFKSEAVLLVKPVKVTAPATQTPGRTP